MSGIRRVPVRTASERPEVDDATTVSPDLRWVLAGERTLLAWFRLSLASFLLGIALLAFVPPGVATLPVSLVAAALMVGCAAAAVTGVRRWRRAEQEHLRRRGPGRPDPTGSW